jgi:hypothetical protein
VDALRLSRHLLRRAATSASASATASALLLL